MNTIQIRLERSLHRQSICGVIRSGDGRAFMTNITFTTADAGVCLPDEAFFQLEDGKAQALMDDLWSCGVRPTEGAGSAGAMAMALERIADLKLQCNDLWDVNRRLIGELTGKAIE